ncbi:hypothetical protein [Ensifer soli]|uniref:hypothetical protein n=1 Tax=Ciceribacter sp. sgz301302 TaxID=3342379 RepID=UPI0035B745DD
MDLSVQQEIASVPDLAHRLRQLRWFRRSFALGTRVLSRRYGLSATVDEEVLARVFLDWVDVLERKKPLAAVNRADFIMFAGGLVLRELIRARPVRVELKPVTAGTPVPEIVAFWPEGFVYTHFCISAVCAVHQQEFGKPLPLSKSVDDLRTWWSFRDNTRDMPAYAIAFLDRFFDAEPNWAVPDLPEFRRAMRLPPQDALPSH